MAGIATRHFATTLRFCTIAYRKAPLKRPSSDSTVVAEPISSCNETCLESAQFGSMALGGQMTKPLHLCIIALVSCTASIAAAADRLPWPSTLPVYDHIVIVVEENKDFEQILGGRFDAPYIKKLAAEGAVFERMFAEEHFSQGNYFWLFSGSNQNVGFLDQVPSKATHPNYPFQASNLGEQLIGKGFSFKGYSESLPNIGSTADLDPRTAARTNACTLANMSPG